MNERHPMNEPEDAHYCSSLHAEEKRACDLCLAQRRRQRDDRMLREAKPTLLHQPFSTLLAGRQ